MTQAQTLLNLEKNCLSNDDSRNQYYLFGLSDDEGHNCSDWKPAIKFIERLVKVNQRSHTYGDEPIVLGPFNPVFHQSSAPPEFESDSQSARPAPKDPLPDFRPSTKCPSPVPNEQSPGFSSPTERSSPQPEEPSSDFSCSSEPSTERVDSGARRRRSVPRPGSGRKHKPFAPSDWQKSHCVIVDNKYRTEGGRFLVEWASKPGVSAWLREEEVAEHYPSALQDYMSKFKQSNRRRLSSIIKHGAGHSCG